MSVEDMRRVNIKHGHAKAKGKSVLYRAWCNMWWRCDHRNERDRANYFDRGIRVCRRRESFSNFIADVGDRPSSRHTLDRKNNNKGYTPNNVRWATRRQQNNNSRRVHKVTWNGQVRSLTAWSAATGIHRRTLVSRLQAGWPLKKVFETTPSPANRVASNA